MESGHQKTKENIIPCGKFRLVENDPNADRAQLFAESVERHFDRESNHFDSKHFDEVNKFIEDNHRYFYPPEDPDDY